MTKDQQAPDQVQDMRLEHPLRRHLKEIEREQTPERLLVLARELQRLLRRSEG